MFHGYGRALPAPPCTAPPLASPPAPTLARRWLPRRSTPPAPAPAPPPHALASPAGPRAPPLSPLDRAPLIDGEARISLARRALRVVGAGLLGGVITSAAGVLAHELMTGELWRVSDVTFAGQVNASEPALRHLANVRVGTHIFDLDLHAVVREVERHPWVRRA